MSTNQIEIVLKVKLETLQLLCDQYNRINSYPDSPKRSRQLQKLQTWIDTVNYSIQEMHAHKTKAAG